MSEQLPVPESFRIEGLEVVSYSKHEATKEQTGVEAITYRDPRKKTIFSIAADFMGIQICRNCAFMTAGGKFSFSLMQEAVDFVRDNLPGALKFFAEVEAKMDKPRDRDRKLKSCKPL